MDNEQLAGIARQQLLMRMSDKPGQWRDDGLDAFRSLLRAQREAISGESDGGFSAMSVPF
jgi:hypothetical protein